MVASKSQMTTMLSGLRSRPTLRIVRWPSATFKACIVAPRARADASGHKARLRVVTTADPVKITSGGGYAFEDRVGAWLAAALLGGQAPLDAELGAPVRIDFQVSVDGWRLDDVLVTFRAADADVRWAASVKSNAQFSSVSAPADFVARCWEEIGGRSGSGFEPERDLVGLVSAPLTGTTGSDLHELVRLAREQDPVDLERRVQQPGYISQQRRKLWTSFEPPSGLSPAESIGPSASPAEVLRRLRLLQADFDFSPSQFEARAVEWCRQALVDGDQAAALWKQLLTVVSPVRTAGGVLTYARLAQRLDGFELAVLPRYEGDHRMLSDLSARNLDGVVESLTGGLHLRRREQLAAVAEAAAADRFLALVGPSGVGKTALARAWARDREVLWLNAEDLPALVAPGAAGALRHPLLEVLSAWPRRVRLIIDGLDRAFAEPVMRGAATLIRALRDTPGGAFGVVVTVQQQEWPRVSDAFADANAGVVWRQVPIGGFGDAELDTAYEAFPILHAVAVRSRLGSVLRNAKVLDVVTRRLESGAPLDAGVALADEASFATWFVEHLAAGSGSQRNSRIRALLAVAEQQADLLQTATALLDVPDAGADQLDALQRDGVWVIIDGKVSFAHDLYGDWARYSVLRSRDVQLGAYLASRLASPLWHRAIRLYATGLLADPDTERWRRELERIDPGEPGFMHDLFMEAALYAGDPEPALERLWPELEADGGRLLRRLLRRFLHVATVPDPRLVTYLTAADPGLATHVAATQRIPYWPLWLPLLAVLHRHADAAVQHAGKAAADLADLWLRSAKFDWPLRREAADLAIRYARQVMDLKSQGVYGFEEVEKAAWRAALAAVRERPDDVEDIALTLCGSTAESGEVVDDEQDDDLLAVDSPRRRPGPDRYFRDVCLDSDALHPLIQHVPRLAADVLVALLAPTPPRRDSLDLFGELGMDRLTDWSMPLYTRGPFLIFLRTAPDEALDTALRVINAATERWAADRERWPLDEPDESIARRSQSGVELVIGDEVLSRSGDGQVMFWYRGAAQVPRTLSSLLMAIEKWLYDEHDAGRDIAPVCRRLLRGSSSMAVVGLLGAVACRHPELLAGPLRPLLSAPEVLIWDAHYKRLPHEYLLTGLFWEPPVLQELAKEWHELEHRHTTIEQLALSQLLQDEQERRYFTALSEGWLARVDEHGEPAALRFLAARFDPDSWQERTDESGVAHLKFEAPEELRAESEVTLRELAERRFWLTLPMQCRQVLDGLVTLDADSLEETWQRGHSLLERDPPSDLTDDGVVSKDDVACGFAATFIVGHRAWLREHPERERWCVDTLIAAVDTPRDLHFMDSPGSGVEWSWDYFCAEALPRLWAERPDDVRLRSGIARLAQNPHYKTISRLFATSASVRDRLGDDFGRLRHLAVHVAAQREDERLRAPAARPAAVSSRARLQPYITAYVDGSLDPRMPSWASLAVPSTKRQRPRRQGIDEPYLHAAHAWIPSLDEARDQSERADWVAFFRQALESLVRRLVRDRDERRDEADGTPYEHEYSLLRALPERVLQLPRRSGRVLWEPLLVLGSYAHYWVDSFLDAWFGTGMVEDGVRAGFVDRWRDMVAFTATVERWQDDGDYHTREERWVLMGLGDGAIRRWTDEHRPTIAEMRPHYQQWANHNLDHPWAAIQFVRFLANEAAGPLLEDGLVWLASAGAERGRDQSRFDEALESMLADVIGRRPQLARSQTPGGAALRSLVHGLVNRQSAIGLELMARVRG